MRTKTTFRPTCGDALEARDVPSSFHTNIIVRGGPTPPAHVYPVGVITPYAITHAPTSPIHSMPVTPPNGGPPFLLMRMR